MEVNCQSRNDYLILLIRTHPKRSHKGNIAVVTFYNPPPYSRYVNTLANIKLGVSQSVIRHAKDNKI